MEFRNELYLMQIDIFCFVFFFVPFVVFKFFLIFIFFFPFFYFVLFCCCFFCCFGFLLTVEIQNGVPEAPEASCSVGPPLWP